MKSKTLSVGEKTKVLDAKGQKLSDTKAAVAACSYYVFSGQGLSE